MKKLILTIFSIVATAIISTSYGQLNLDVEGTGIIRAATPKLDFYDTNAGRTETYMFSANGNFYLHSRYGDILFRADDNAGFATRMLIDGTNGNVGIGTSNPGVKLHVAGGSDLNLNSGGYAQLGNTSGWNLVMDENEIQARDNGDGNTLYINYEGGDLLLNSRELGQVGIGVLSSASLPADPSYLLAVDGKIIAEELRVELSGAWPDYVFKDDYELLSIDEFASSIKANGHLPGIPSAAEVEEKGHLIGDIQRKMLEKMEEMSLYIIQLNEKNIELGKEISLLKKALK